MLPVEAASDGCCVVALCEISEFDVAMSWMISGSIGSGLGRSTLIACLALEQSDSVIGSGFMSESPEKNSRERHGWF